MFLHCQTAATVAYMRQCVAPSDGFIANDISDIISDLIAAISWSACMPTVFE